MPEIVRCHECDRETYIALGACPHCGAEMPPELAAAEAPGGASGGGGAAAFGAFLVRLLIFNGSYWATISAIEAYDRYAYGEQAVPGGAHHAVALLILGGFVLLNLIYVAVEGIFWQSLKDMRPVFHLLFPVAAFVGISVFLLFIMFLRNL